MPLVQRQVVETVTKPKGFFRRVGSYINKLCGGKTEQEVAKCKGKSLGEMAEMESKKDVVQISSKHSNWIKAVDAQDNYFGLREKRMELERKYATLEKQINSDTFIESANIRRDIKSLEERKAKLKNKLQEGPREGKYDAAADRYWGTETRENYHNRMAGYITELESIEKQLNELYSKQKEIKKVVTPIQIEFDRTEIELIRTRTLEEDAKRVFDEYKQYLA